MTENELRYKLAKKRFTSKEFIEHQIWIYSSFSAASLAFFLALFSAGDKAHTSLILQTCVFLFSVSLTINSGLAFLFASSKDDGEFVHELNLSKSLRFFPLIGFLSFSFAVLSLVSFYSYFASGLIVLISIILYVLFKLAIKELLDKQEREHHLELEKIKKGIYED